MSANMIGIIIILVLLIVLVVLGIVIYRKAKRKLRQISGKMGQVQNLVREIQRQEVAYANTPKSVSGATSLYLPQIARDFPEFHNEEMKERAENVLVSYLQSIHESNAQLLTEGTKELKEELEMKIRANHGEGIHECFEKIQIHRTEISKYNKEKGRCSIVYQSAIACVHYVVKNGSVIRGRKDMLTQYRYNVEVCYIQDRDLVEDSSDAGFALNCPNCGGPLKNLGAKVCPYCDSPVLEINIRAWTFSDVEEVK